MRFDSCWVLLQPEWSFGYHNIGADHAWDDTKTTVRQKIRYRFRDSARLYYVPPARFYPMAPMIVPPLEIGDKLLDWWIPLDERKKEQNQQHKQPEDPQQEEQNSDIHLN